MQDMATMQQHSITSPAPASTIQNEGTCVILGTYLKDLSPKQEHDITKVPYSEMFIIAGMIIVIVLSKLLLN
jgi:hypothetical protein